MNTSPALPPFFSHSPGNRSASCASGTARRNAVRLGTWPLLAALTWLVLPAAVVLEAANPLEQGFDRPPQSTKPWCYWYWISDNLSRDGITRDLEAMARVGIGAAFVGNVDVNEQARGTVKVLTDEWWALVEHAIREGGRLGVDIGLFNCPGWSQSGGPWIRPDQAMRHLAFSETRVHGPTSFNSILPSPKEPFQDVAVLAFRPPHDDAATVGARSPRLEATPEIPDLARLTDGRSDTVCALPPSAAGQPPVAIDLELAEPFTARSLVLHPAPTATVLKGELEARDDHGRFARVRQFTLDRHNLSLGVGFVPAAPVALAFPAVTARQFRLTFRDVPAQAGLAEIELTGAARLERFPEKQLAKMFQDPLPMWDHYLWPPQAEPEAPDLAVGENSVIDLTHRLAPDGTLRWDVPAGDWVLLRIGMALTGMKNSPASPEGTGLEVDKMNRVALAAHFNAFIGKVLERMPARDRRAFRYVVADSYEMGSQNWTDGFAALFRQTYGYDPQPWFPVLTGRLVGSADQSNRFLWDLRRLIADRVAYDYVGGLRELCERHGLELWLENYGHWGFPAEFLQYGGQSHRLGGEFWATGDLGSIELRAASSAAHLYGKPVVSAEAFTGGPPFVSTPWSLKRRGDWAVTEGINHFVLHVYIHQPDERRPGINAWFGTEFNRHNTWFDPGTAWVDYLRRTHFLLQKGRHVADVACFIGEDTPKMTGVRQPELPPGYDFDYVNAEAIERRFRVRNGRFVLPDGKSYRLLVLPDLDTMRPELLRRLRDLVTAGGNLLGPPPSRSPSLERYPAADLEVRRIAAELWGADATQTPGGPAGQSSSAASERRVGKGRVFRSASLAPVLEALDTPPDVTGIDPHQLLWTHRTTPTAEVYFLSNQRDVPVRIAPRFRVQRKAPELWYPDTARRTSPVVFAVEPDGLRLPIDLDARGSVFVVFRKPLGTVPGITRVTRDGDVLATVSVTAAYVAAPTANSNVANTFTLAGWVKPSIDIALPAETNSGVFLNLARNEAVTPAHGNTWSPDPGHAGAGLSVGRNGVVVYEHGANYFAPVLVHYAALTAWTHVAVVYREGQPRLYLDGHPAHTGLPSRFVTHPSAPGAASPAGPFQGDLGEFQVFDRALAEGDLASLAKSPPPATTGAVLPPITLERGRRHRLEAEIAAPGRYRLEFANGGSHTFELVALPSPLTLDGPWQVSFPAHMDVPTRVTFDALASWTEHADESVKHFAGTATYTRTFDLPAVLLEARPAPPLYLDLGKVEAMAEVILNGRSFGVLWKPPFLVDVAPAARIGANTLEVRVTSVWRNRLVGDRKYPNGFPNRSPLEFKPYLAVDVGFRADDRLLPAGLLGPVRLLPARRIDLNP